MAFVVVGTWAGYNGRDRVVHQETIQDDSLKPKYDAIRAIRYTDGTYLGISTYDLLHPPQNLGYKEMLDKAVAKGLEGTFSVTDL